MKRTIESKHKPVRVIKLFNKGFTLADMGIYNGDEFRRFVSLVCFDMNGVSD